MSTPITIGLGILGAGLGGRVLWQALRGGASVGAANFAVGGFQGKMDKSEAMKVLGIKYVHAEGTAHLCFVADQFLPQGSSNHHQAQGRSSTAHVGEPSRSRRIPISGRKDQRSEGYVGVSGSV